jgi:hypothetical protein
MTRTYLLIPREPRFSLTGPSPARLAEVPAARPSANRDSCRRQLDQVFSTRFQRSRQRHNKFFSKLPAAEVQVQWSPKGTPSRLLNESPTVAVVNKACEPVFEDREPVFLVLRRTGAAAGLAAPPRGDLREAALRALRGVARRSCGVTTPRSSPQSAHPARPASRPHGIRR